MRTVFVLFDSLNRLALECYGGNTVKTPNFNRFAKQAMTFDHHYTGSLPCMPARRDMHTGRLCYPHRSWGPLEPFDNSFAQILKENGVQTHMITDHLHYFEDGGSGYHTRFSTWEFIRGQEHDPWIGMANPPIEKFAQTYAADQYPLDQKNKRFQGMINREVIKEETDYPGPKCFARAFDYLNRNKKADDWFLMLECFDPHEPFTAPARFRKAYQSGYNGKVLDWPKYERVKESEVEMREIRANYAALVAMCDEYFGKLLDYFDEHDMWKDTALVLSTDHGFLLSEHEWWGKCRMPYYEEMTHIPLMIHDPRHIEADGKRTKALTQTTDLMPTFLGLHNAEIPKEVRANNLENILVNPDEAGLDVATFAVFGGPIGITDGRYVLYYYPPDTTAPGLKEYTLQPSHMTAPFTAAEIKTAALYEGFDFTKGQPVLSFDALPDAIRIPMNDGFGFEDTKTSLYDLEQDPGQNHPIEDQTITDRLLTKTIAVLKAHDTPREVYGWYGLEGYMK